jgi:hypothetical protein
MEEEASQPIVMIASAKEQLVGSIDSTLCSMRLLKRSAKVRKVTDLTIGGIDIQPIPACLAEGKSAILVSNYPSVNGAMRAVIKVGCRLPGDSYRLNAIGRPEVITQATPVLKALGIKQHVFPVHKDDAGVYRLDRRVLRDILAFLDQPGNVLWMSITGSTRGNGLLEEDLRTGAAQFALSKRIPLVPMALVTTMREGKPRIIQAKFGEPILASDGADLSDFEKTDYLNDLTRLAMCRVAQLLPPGQRADFENVDEKLEEAYRRLQA